MTGTVRNILLSPSSGNFPAWQQRSAAAGGGKELESLYKLVRMLGATAGCARVCLKLWWSYRASPVLQLSASCGAGLSLSLPASGS